MKISTKQATPEAQPLLPFSRPPQQYLFADSRDNVKGYVYMMLSTFGYTGMSAFARAAESKFDFPAYAILFVRGCIATTMAIILIMSTVGFRKALEPVNPRIAFLLGLRGLGGAGGLLFILLAWKYLPLGDAVTLFFSNPIMVMLISYMFLNEPVTIVEIIAAITSIGGIALIAHPLTTNSETISAHARIIGSGFALLGAFAASISCTVIRSISSEIHFSLNMLVFGFTVLLVSLMLNGQFGWAFVLANKMGCLMALCSSFFAFLGQALMTKGLEHCKAGPGLLIRTIDVPVLYLIGIFFLDEVPSATRLLGSTLVFGSVVTIGLRRFLGN